MLWVAAVQFRAKVLQYEPYQLHRAPSPHLL
jgi:hypothetical protein